MGAMAAGIKPEVAVRTLGAGRDGCPVVAGQCPGMCYFSTAKWAAQTIGVAQSQFGSVASEQVSLFLGRKRLDPRSPPVTRRRNGSDECPTKAMCQAVLSTIYPDAPGAASQENQYGQADC
jgi:hypothetical protein